MTYVLSHARGQGLGFCNMNDAQIADFVTQVKIVVNKYNLDGINLWDRNSGYGKEGMAAVNTTSYPKLIVALRAALGNERLLTVTDHEAPTESFWDTAATGGIEVGQYIDYAWSGYNDENEPQQIIDPYHQGAE
ncbi:MAG: glycosyl hydrolase family 18, partial [Alistipes sp.]